jgi:outer membrane protein
MKLRLLARALICSALLLFVAVPQARAEISIAVVDVEALMSESSAAKSIKEQVKAQSAKFEAEMQSLEKQLNADLDKLKQEGDKLTPEEKEKRGAAFYQKRAESKKTLKKSFSALRKGENQALSKLTDAIFEVCAKLAEERKYDLVITRGNVIVGSKALDITADVMKNLNESLPTVKMTVAAE